MAIAYDDIHLDCLILKYITNYLFNKFFSFIAAYNYFLVQIITKNLYILSQILDKNRHEITQPYV